MILGLASGAVALCYLLAPGTCPFLSFVLLISSPLTGLGECFREESSREVVCESSFSGRDGENHVQKD